MIKQYQWRTFLGLLSSTGVFSSSLTTLHPLVTLPKTTCFPSRCDVGTVVMKNCEPLVFSPAFAIERRPRSSCCDKINKTKKLKQGISWLFLKENNPRVVYESFWKSWGFKSNACIKKNFLSAMFSAMQNFEDFLVIVHHCTGEAKFCTPNSCNLTEVLTRRTKGWLKGFAAWAYTFKWHWTLHPSDLWEKCFLQCTFLTT